MSHDPGVLPEDLPVPVDDGAADHLVGLPVPSIALPATNGKSIHALPRAGERTLADPLEVLSVADVDLLPPIPRPPSIRDSLCFLDHARNTSAALGQPTELAPVWSQIPAFYFANANGVFGAHDEVPIPPGCRWFDLELEVAAILGKGGRDLTPEQAEDNIVGYTLLCDWSVRDLQLLEMGLRIGQAKAKDIGVTLGPALVTADELNPHRRNGKISVEVRGEVNGQVLTTGRTDTMDWTFGEVISYASRGVELEAGDIFGSGTVPMGCLVEHLDVADPNDFTRWPRPGDVVSLAGEGLGATQNTIVAGTGVHRLRSGF